MKTATNPHFDSLQFLNSSGSWDSKGERFVFGGITKSDPVLVVVNTKTGKREKEVVFKELGEILNPTWSPDGMRIAFTSKAEGDWQVYVMNADGSGITRLTNIVGGAIRPAWSPDGQLIAFEAYGDILVMNPDGGNVTNLTNDGRGNGAPCWSPDGTSIAFQSHRDNNAEIHIMSSNGYGQQNLTNNPANDWEPSW